MKLRIAGALVGVALVATACGGGSSATSGAQSPVSSPPVASDTPSPVVTPTAKATPKPAAVVTLGIHDPSIPYQKGYGTARPTEVSVGGDSSGNVGDITWDSWGGAQATGTGTSGYGGGRYGACTAFKAAHPGSSETCEQRVPIVAYNLKDNCGGHPGYNTIEWYFPLAGETRDLTVPAYDNLCTLQDVPSASVPTTAAPPTVTASAPQRDVADLTKPAHPFVELELKGTPNGYALAFADSGSSVNLRYHPTVSTPVFGRLVIGTYVSVGCYEHGDLVVNGAGRSSDIWYWIALGEGMDGFMPSVFIDKSSGNSSWDVPACPAGTGGFG
jgi:hypothetical protein